MSAPIRHTCPDIDRLQKTLKGIASDIEAYAGEEYRKELKSLAGDIESIYKYDLEDLRKSNETLRKYGEEQEDRADSLESELNAAQEEINELKALENDIAKI